MTVANAEAVDSSKTLLQRRNRPSPDAHKDPAGDRSDGDSERSPSSVGAPGGGARIRISDRRSQLPAELLLGRYRPLARLGAGGFGTVWSAHDELLDRTVAIKRIELPSEEDRERATREALATARLAHPAIVALFEASSDENAFYLISELVEGDTLAELIGADQLLDEDIVEIGLTLVGALEHAHARGVIHRDVKPQNVLVPSDTGEQTPSRGAPAAAAKLADFGGARLAGEDALTRTGDVFGTLAYMAPEQSEGYETGPPADLYSLALVLYEAFTGVNPVRGRTPAATARRIGSPIEPLERHRGDLPRELTRALDMALNPDPHARGELADLHDALADALDRGLRRRLFARRQREESEEILPAAPAAVAEDEERSQLPSSRRRVALPRLLWVGCVLAAAAWQAVQGRAGLSLLLLVAGAPLLALPRRSGPGWLAALLAPVLGLAGLAGAFPALAGQRAGWRARAGLALLGFWWLALAESLLARRLWLGPPSDLPARAQWEGSFAGAASHVVGATLTVELLLGAAVWAVASVILPWIVRGRSAALDVAAAVAWTVA
ncbi:MAG TPA: serine/threonine-protein kinase, partial [Solirubrobacteraceae bacterium]|nr:serine/threonine-protein kinase [Solirubrobacteraceae bacterium]